ncbi:calcium/sodium antiporter [Paludibacteraceae bacterium OttesenSCG-928-F17]|nr:calcium/sodium antiporter [Paludibacteraceae bacterium OttesenSCG-928-F17]
MDYLLIIVGFVLLVVGANYLVDGAVGVAKRFNVPDLVIGLTIVAFGTSAPELVVNLIAAVNPGTTDIALTNIIGSNTINTFVILGATALVFPVRSQLSSRKFDIPLSLLAPLVLILMGCVFGSKISRLDGIILLSIFVFFLFVTVRKTLTVRNAPELESLEEDKPAKPKKLWLSIIMILGGLTMLVIGGELIVSSATKIAEALGISQSIIGITIVALGTSLPELATSVIAAFKKNSDIALGNVVGSNIFNVFLVLGISATVRPLPAYNNMLNDLLIVALGSLLVLIFVLTNKNHQIKRWEGLLLLVIYGVYLTWMITNING